MALCHNCDDARIKYTGNGSQTDYTFPFEYNERTDVAVAFWNEDVLLWETQPDTDWEFLNDTTIQFTTAPANDQQFVIYRCTDLDPLPATFHPGHSIKAQDLNDNFFVLDLAIDEVRCAIQRQDDKSQARYWNKVDATDFEGETVYSEQPWVSSDETVSTTLAQDERFWDTADETTYMGDDWASEADDSHVPTTGAVDKHIDEAIAEIEAEKITEIQQVTGAAEARISDDTVFSSAAARARHDTYSQDPTPASLAFEQPGKFWYDTETLSTYVWDTNSQSWVTVDKTGSLGPPGPPGPIGPSGVIIVSDDPPTEHPNGGSEGEPRPLREGDIWFNSESTQLFIYYLDNTGFQWVSVTAKGPKGDPGDGSGPAYDFKAPLQENLVTGDVIVNLNTLASLPS